jgi:signal transduction histidine kinase
MVIVGVIFLLIPLALMLNVVSADAIMQQSIIRLIPFPLAVFPIACDYAIFHTQLVGTTSLLSRRVMRVLLWLLLASLFVFPCLILLHYLSETGILQGETRDYLYAALLVASLFLFPLAWNKVRDAGDQVFYRDFYQYNRSLRQLSAALTRLHQLDEVQSLVFPRLANLLNTNDVALLVWNNQGENPAYSTLIHNDKTWNLYHYAATPSTLSPERLTSIANLALTHLERPSYDPLLLDGVLLLALYESEQLRGFLCLGPKRNVEPYSRQDTSFLATLASQLAVLEVNHRYLVQAQADAQKLVALNRRVISAQEEERKHLALDLHDEVLQQAMLLVRQLSDAATMGEVADTMPLARSLVTSLRRTCLELRPPLLDELGLEEALCWLARQAEQRSGGTTHVQVSCEGKPIRPQAQIELALYRVAQEALSNALKYAHASTVKIRLRYTERGSVSLLIRDNGRGFSTTHNTHQNLQEASEHLGLIGMHERMAATGGTLQMRSAQGQGVTIRAYSPSMPTMPTVSPPELDTRNVEKGENRMYGVDNLSTESMTI